MELSNQEILARFPDVLRKNMHTLLMENHIGLSGMAPRVNLHHSKLTYNIDLYKGNSFSLDIPYAGKHLFWEVIFSDENLSFAPDFDFLNDSFLSDPDIDEIEREIPSLLNWNVKEENSLLNVIKEFVQLYKKYQLIRLEEDKFQLQLREYMKLLNHIDADDIEIYIDQNENVHFLINIKADFSELPPYMQNQYFMDEGEILNPSTDAAVLQVTYTINNRTTTQLQLSPRLDSVISQSSKLSIPPYNKDSGLGDFVFTIKTLFNDKINFITSTYAARHNLITAILSLHGNGVLEYDVHYFSKISILIDVDDFHAIAIITLSKQFPQQPPAFQLNSIGHELKGKVVTDNLIFHAYNETSDAKTMARDILLFLRSSVIKFTNSSNYH